MLLADDDVVLRERLAKALRGRGYEVRTAGSFEEAMALAREESPEFAIVDLRMPGKQNGLDLVKALKDVDASTRILVLTGLRQHLDSGRRNPARCGQLPAQARRCR